MERLQFCSWWKRWGEPLSFSPLLFYKNTKKFLFSIDFPSTRRPSLTSSQPQTRARGVQLLSEVLQDGRAELSQKEGQNTKPFRLLKVRSVVDILLSHRSGSAHGFLPEPPQRPSRHHSARPTGAARLGKLGGPGFRRRRCWSLLVRRLCLCWFLLRPSVRRCLPARPCPC